MGNLNQLAHLVMIGPFEPVWPFELVGSFEMVGSFKPECSFDMVAPFELLGITDQKWAKLKQMARLIFLGYLK